MRPDQDRVERIYKAQTGHRDRLIHKHANKEAPGKPPYLDSFRYTDYSIAKELSKSILESTARYKSIVKEELEMIKSMLEFKRKTERRGGMPTKKFMDRYPGDEAYKEHLQEKYGFEFVLPRKILRLNEGLEPESENFFDVLRGRREA